MIQQTGIYKFVVRHPIIFIIVVLGMFAVACTVFKEILKTTQEVVITPGGNLSIPKVTLGRACDKTETRCIEDVLIIHGEISQATIDEIRQSAKIHSNLDVSTVCFNSRGGNVRAATALWEIIFKSNLSTCMAELYFTHDSSNKKLKITNPHCHSVCNYLLLASDNRIALGEEFNIGTHSSGTNISFCVCEIPLSWSYPLEFNFKSLLGRENNPDRNDHIAFLNFGSSVSFSDVHMLTKEELVSFAIFNTYK